MPDLTGLPLAIAQEQLARVGVKAATPRVAEAAAEGTSSGEAPLRPLVRPGLVRSQQPQAGFRVDQNMLVKLTVAK
jgi:beta-lactam-binding protein with PASTA domain